ncbi:Fur family transcriptional regulator [Roseospira navarrensis]|uniref:Transcriptional repressor n=1 Tax=Roseospira navarrensis TaxID=140058 RepID=A0A7X2D380_9PROT|nr:Fur family transcriptional regulator [Roseospira navarrensis]MQX37074.1 transcriptional repressor [Roseospira navarrensis]
MTAAPPKSLTRNQSLVLSALRAGGTPQGAYALLDGLRDQGLRAPVQVYRALERLQALGLVHRLESLNAFVACSHDHGGTEDAEATPGPAVFVICEHCAATRELTDPIIGGRIERLARTEGFGLHTSSIELRGLCAVCTAREAEETETTADP